MKAERALFGTMKDGTEIDAYTLENKNGMKARMISYGAILVNLYVPDRTGALQDVVLGYDRLEGYYTNGCNFGATIGPNANRTAGAAFTLDGVEYRLCANEGPNNLHSHFDLGYHKKVWDVTLGENSVTFSMEAPDGEMGFPGNKKIQVTYSLSEKNELSLHYHAVSDKKTVINMTNHTYFNLSGHAAGEIYDHILTLNAANYTPVAKGSIPTGEIAPVSGTPMDFTRPGRIGDEIDADFEQLKITGGYDHNWVIDGEPGQLRHFATVEDPVSGRTMKACTDLPGVQFYTGNFMEKETGKENALYNRRYGLCLETQYFPNTANEPHFPSAVFGPDREYDTTTVYRFEAH